MTTPADRPVLVTGAAGFVGGHLLDLLEPRTASIVAWRRPGEPLPPEPTGRRCRWMEVDILDRAGVRSALREVRPSAVYHLAGAAHAGRSWDRASLTLQVNVLGTYHVLSALAEQGATTCRTLIPGSALVYGPQERAITEADPVAPVSPYGLSKLAQELTGAHAGSEDGLPVLLTRSFNHIGPRQDASFFAASFARQIARIELGLAEPVLHVGNLDARRDLSDVRDTARAYAALIDRGRPGRIYNVCTGRAYRVGDVLDGLLARASVRIAVRTDSTLYRPRDLPLVLGDPRRLVSEVGWTPSVPMEQTLDDLLAYWRNQLRTISNV
jgi:GDP-4-dehydro-6-deoxy-D-mannose reductase